MRYSTHLLLPLLILFLCPVVEAQQKIPVFLIEAERVPWESKPYIVSTHRIDAVRGKTYMLGSSSGDRYEFVLLSPRGYRFDGRSSTYLPPFDPVILDTPYGGGSANRLDVFIGPLIFLWRNPPPDITLEIVMKALEQRVIAGIENDEHADHRLDESYKVLTHLRSPNARKIIEQAWKKNAIDQVTFGACLLNLGDLEGAPLMDSPFYDLITIKYWMGSDNRNVRSWALERYWKQPYRRNDYECLKISKYTNPDHDFTPSAQKIIDHVRIVAEKHRAFLAGVKQILLFGAIAVIVLGIVLGIHGRGKKKMTLWLKLYPIVIVAYIIFLGFTINAYF